MPKKILWQSRHRPDEGRLAELRRIFGEIEVIIDDSTQFAPETGAADIASRMQSGGFEEIVLVAPTSILDGLVRKGIKPLWPTMSNDRRTFLGFDRVDEIRRVREDVQPAEGANGKRVLWLSRFPPSVGRQTAELKRLFGDDVAITHRDIPNIKRVTQFFRDGYFDALVALVPEAVFERLSAEELPLMRAETPRESDPTRIEWRTSDGRGFRFDRYVWYRIEKVTTRL